MSGASAAPRGARAATEAASAIRAIVGTDPPEVGLILGSGLGVLADRIDHGRRVPYSAIPGFPVPSIAGHAGHLVSGSLAGHRVAALAGRFHVYEGHDAATAAFPVRVLHALGARTLFVSNAAGGVRRTFQPGSLMAIADHANLTGRNPLIGAIEPGDLRFPDMSSPYDPGLRAALHHAAGRVGVTLHDGVYGWTLGPSYETSAEVRMLERVGIDAVGMSTVPEVIVARAIGMRVAGISCVTNLACGISSTPVDHDDVLEVTRRLAGRFEALVVEWLRTGLE